jgi:uncharacterized protein
MLIAVRTNRLALLLVFALTLPLAAHADEASHRTKAAEMMTVLHTQRMVQQISDNLKKQIADAADKIAGPTPTDDAKAKVADFEKKADQLIDAQLSWDTMQAGFTDIYTKNLTEEQLDGIIAFYKSPAGVALLENMPTVNNQVTQFGGSHMTALQPQLKQMFEDFQKNVATAAAPEPATAAPPAVAPPASAAPRPNSPK